MNMHTIYTYTDDSKEAENLGCAVDVKSGKRTNIWTEN